MSGSLLIVSDNVEREQALGALMQGAGFATSSARNCHDALRTIASGECTGVLVDLISEESCGVSVARYLKSSFPELTVVVFNRSLSNQGAFEAFPVETHSPQCWFSDLERPLLDVVDRIWRSGHLGTRTTASRPPPVRAYVGTAATDRDDARCGRPQTMAPPVAGLLLGDSIHMKTARKRIAEVADSDMTVLIRGESGTGKTVAARVIHESSRRRFTGKLSRINCPALPESLLESELFGYERGAFTGADRQKPGRFELAAGGTIFLDEIGAISLAMQAKLLDVLEAKQYFRVGGREVIRMDARLVAATNLHIEEQIQQGYFRADLLYRLNQFAVVLPPLRERSEDVPLLIDHFLRIYGEKYDHPNLTVPEELNIRLQAYPWPGNVRELETTIARFCLTNNITFLVEILAGMAPRVDDPEAPASLDSLHSAERKAVHEALEHSHWNQRKAAEALGISYSSLRRRIAKYEILSESE